LKLKLFYAAGSLALAMTLGASAAYATTAVVDNTNLVSPPGVYFGTGNPNGGFETMTVDNVEIGIRGKVNHGAVPTPVNGNEYDFALGTLSNADYSVNPDMDGASGLAPFSLAGVTQLITFKNLNTNASFSYDPSLLLDNNHSGFGYQNSEQFAFFPVGFNANVDGTYKATLSLTGGGLSEPMAVSALFKYGNGGVLAGVPEPTSWALMLVGFGGLGAALRRNRSQQRMALATAA
jgi:hypothetical protein